METDDVTNLGPTPIVIGEQENCKVLGMMIIDAANKYDYYYFCYSVDNARNPRNTKQEMVVITPCIFNNTFFPRGIFLKRFRILLGYIISTSLGSNIS